MKRTAFTLILLIIFSVSNLRADEISIKVETLLAKMTIEEKIGQMNLHSTHGDITGPGAARNVKKKIQAGNCGNILNAVGVKNIRRLQQIAVEKSRLGIPLLFGYDVIHGYKTIFPIPLGMASSWDMVGIENSARIAATEAAASGINWTFAPMVDISRDPRWGRIAESPGEDTFLGCESAKANVRGFQGKDLSDSLTIAACAKHFAAYGAAQAGRDYHTVDMSERMLREIYLPPFKAAVDANVASLMTSFNELNGIPATGNSFLLKNILRDEWGFKGIVVTDFTSIKEMINHGVAADLADAAELALNAGVDMDMMSDAYIGYIKLLLEKGCVSEEQINNAVRNILTIKFKLGLFENPYLYCDKKREKKLIYAKEHLRAAYDIAAKSMVLLKNKNQLLPLSTGKRIAVIGPLADSRKVLLGSWKAQGGWDFIETVLKGIVRNNGKTHVDYAKGCKVNGNDKSGFAEAIELAKKSDLVIMVLGETERMSGEASSRSNINLPGVQTELLQSVAKAGKSIVLVLLNGRPLTLEKEDALADAILEAWQPGTEGGKAVADMLFGKVIPSGKLTATFPRNLGQVPIFYNMKNGGRPFEPKKYGYRFMSQYLDCPNDPLYPFGYGLSYTDFEYSKINLSNSTIKNGESLTASVTVSNIGNFDGEEVVQLYIRDLVGSVTRPVKELKGFKKIFLRKGERKKVEFSIGKAELMFLRGDMTWGTEPGKFELFIGTNSRDAEKMNFILK